MHHRLGILSSLLICACTGGEPALEVKATPRTLDGLGQTAVLRIIATDAQGNVGKGSVKIESAAGTLSDSRLTLDSLGTATTSFICTASSDPACVGAIRITATWSVGGANVTGQTTVTISAPFDAGVGSDITGPLAFPVGAVFPSELTSVPAHAISTAFLIWNLNICHGPPLPSRTVIALSFDSNEGVAVGSYAVSGGIPGSSVSFAQFDGLPDGGSVVVDQGQAVSGTCSLSRFDLGDAGNLSSVTGAGTFDVMVRRRDGGLVPLTGSFATTCP
jgi:hypothetical protein